jgi:hypothetical protein
MGNGETPANKHEVAKALHEQGQVAEIKSAEEAALQELEEPPEGVVSAEELIASFEEVETRTVEGCLVQGLSGLAYQQVKSAMLSMALRNKADHSSAAQEELLYLQHGVITPKLLPKQWRALMDKPGGARKIGRIVSAIKDLTGVTELEAIELGGVSENVLATLRNSM